DDSLKVVLRRVRQQAIAHIALRDLTGHANLAEVVESMTLLADITTNFALSWLHPQLTSLYGEPLDNQGQAQKMLIIGMGKLGGRELNVSSDVDYIFIYPEDGETSGPKRIDNFEFFGRLGKKLIAAIGEITSEGQVFRVDMRLRPNGDSGPLACSLDALENYFITQGREWERYAWIKARVMNEGDNLQPHWAKALNQIARPFVFRKYLDFGAINAMRGLHAQIRREVARKDRVDHIKLGPGGIREIEFLAQVFQLIRGGRDTRKEGLQTRPTLTVLKRLQERDLISTATEQELRQAYGFLRTLEHRLQYVGDQQTHMLPDNPERQAALAPTMGFANWAELLAELNRHRERVSQHFESVFSDPEAGEHALSPLWLGQLDNDAAIAALEGLGFRDPHASWARLQEVHQSARYQALPATNRERLDAVGPRLLEAARATPQPDLTLQRGLSFLEIISRRGAYLALLQQYPQALQKVADMVGSAAWAAHYLNRHPILLDELLYTRLLDTATDVEAFSTQLCDQLTAVAGDTEREMDLLREAHHAQVFRLLAQDLAGLHTIERISDHLSLLADTVLKITLDLCWQTVRTRHRETPAFAVIGYGKLGGKELGYSSDLDMVYLYDDESQDSGQNYTRLGQRLNTWLSSQTPAGFLFETDLRLRPNGDAGLLAVSLEAFREYQLNNAWVWEHQALTRARFCAGDSAVGEKFEAIRREILSLPRDPNTLRDEVVAMRQRMLDNHGSHTEGYFDLKQDRGGIIDVEFIVQYLILAHAHQFPELTQNLGNIALLGMAEKLGLIPVEAATAAQVAYREYRRLQHAKRLNDEKGLVPYEEIEQHAENVKNLWKTTFNSAQP
ncbi:MAG: hypothetical protein RIR18_962, partial [Pseudomonadota bacterium]